MKIIKLILLFPVILLWVALVFTAILFEAITSLILVSSDEIDKFISNIKP